MDKKIRCKNCTSCKPVNANGGFKFLGCFAEPLKGKWILEIEKCPKED